MGLDMYLAVCKHAYASKYAPKEQDTKIVDLVSGIFGFAPSQDSPSVTVKMTIGYWRKANAIHSWFVKNCQDGIDECQTTHVSVEKLQQLRSTCEQVLDSVELVNGKNHAGTTYHSDGRIEKHFFDGDVVAQPNIAASILPTQEGFFFGNTDYDQGYIQDVKDTISILDVALQHAKESDVYFEYHASW
jgi:hypothetical protein